MIRYFCQQYYLLKPTGQRFWPGLLLFRLTFVIELFKSSQTEDELVRTSCYFCNAAPAQSDVAFTPYSLCDTIQGRSFHRNFGHSLPLSSECYYILIQVNDLLKFCFVYLTTTEWNISSKWTDSKAPLAICPLAANVHTAMGEILQRRMRTSCRMHKPTRWYNILRKPGCAATARLIRTTAQGEQSIHTMTWFDSRCCMPK